MLIVCTRSPCRFVHARGSNLDKIAFITSCLGRCSHASRASLRLFVSARSHLAEQGLHLCAKRKFVRAAQHKGAGGPARSCRGLCLGKCPFWLCSDGARFWVCTAPHLSANLLGVRATFSRSSFKTTHTKTATRPRSLAIHQALCHSTSKPFEHRFVHARPSVACAAHHLLPPPCPRNHRLPAGAGRCEDDASHAAPCDFALVCFGAQSPCGAGTAPLR